ncbi:hypothetical protein E2C01_091909 [Portunus trituberculatus]|jgi:hypothetical protein
MVVR